MPWIDLERFGAWCNKEAGPFIVAFGTGTATAGPLAGLATAMTTTNRRGGNPLGDAGKKIEPVVQTYLAVTDVHNVVHKFREEAAKEAATKLAKEVAAKASTSC